LPFKIFFASILFLVENTPCTYLIIHNCHWLKSIGKYDVRIHCRYVYVINEWFTFNKRTLVS
jgi:hypothetical protein